MRMFGGFRDSLEFSALPADSIHPVTTRIFLDYPRMVDNSFDCGLPQCEEHIDDQDAFAVVAAALLDRRQSQPLFLSTPQDQVVIDWRFDHRSDTAICWMRRVLDQ